MRNALSHVGIDDVVATLGLALIGSGVALIYVPAALIVVGIALVGLAVWRL